MPPQKLIGLTGNIATGKSTVAAMLHVLGAAVIDADQVARDVVRTGQPALAEIARAFGAGVLLPDGQLNRQALGNIVFADARQLKILEAITHPAIRAEMERQLNALDDRRVAVIEVIKLFESGWADRCTQVWVTTCTPETQAARLTQSRGLDTEAAWLRVRAQPDQREKLARADVVIDTSADLDETRRQVKNAWDAL